MSTKKLQILDSLVLQAENANTLEGKPASAFASASEIEQLQTLVGDEPVADQISSAIQENTIVIDTTLTQGGQAADAKVTGDELALREVTSNKTYSKDDITESNKETLYPSLAYMEKYYYDYDEIDNIFRSATTNENGNLVFIASLADDISGLIGSKTIVTDCNVKYTLTENDKNEIATAVKTDCTQIEPNFANSIEECTDTSKVYVLPDGYIYAYMATITEGTSTPNFTNLMDDSNAYIKEGYRYSHSSQAFKECSTDTAIIVPITKADSYTIRVIGATLTGCQYISSIYLGTTNSKFEGTIINAVAGDFEYSTNDNGEILLVAKKVPDYTYSYMVFHVARGVNVDSLIVTVNEEISYTTTEGGVVYDWKNTGHAFVPTDYEDRIIDVENEVKANGEKISELKNEINKPAPTGIVTMFISPTGNDSNDGLTANYPKKTVKACVEAGATRISAKRGIYREEVSLSNIDTLEIFPTDNNYTNKDVHRYPPIVFDTSDTIAVDSLVDYNAIKSVAYSKQNNAFSYVFTNGLYDTVYSTIHGYHSVIWLITDNIKTDKKLRPVASIAEVESNADTFTYIDNTIYLNADLTNVQEIRVPTSYNNAFTVSTANKVKLTEVEINFAGRYNLFIENCPVVEIDNCSVKYSSNGSGFDLKSANGILRNCYASRVHDGYGIGGCGHTIFIDCTAEWCFDDGMSHHTKCTGTVIGGRFEGNRKGGNVPAYGANVNIYGGLYKDNQMYGIAYITDSTHNPSTGMVQGAVMVGNDKALVLSETCTVTAVNCDYIDNNVDKDISGTLIEHNGINSVETESYQSIEFVETEKEFVDTNKLYVLPDGTIYRYDAVTTSNKVPNFTNLIECTDAYIKAGYRYSHSNQAFVECASDTAIIVPVTNVRPLTIRMMGATLTGCQYPWSVYFGTTNTSFPLTATNLIDTDVILNEDIDVDGSITISRPPSATYNYMVFHVANSVDVSSLIVTVNEKIEYIFEKDTSNYQWQKTTYNFLTEDQKQSYSELEKDIDNIKDNLGTANSKSTDSDIFSVPAYAPVPQLPADGSEGSDFNYKTITTQDAYDYMDELCNQYRYKGYITKQTMGRDASDSFDHNRYILSKSYWKAWQKENYPKMYAWKCETEIIYSVSVSPRVGDSMYSTEFVGTVYGTVESVNVTAGILSTRTINGSVFTRYLEGDIEPTLVYTKPLQTPRTPNTLTPNPTFPVYDANFAHITYLPGPCLESYITIDGVRYDRYPFDDRKLDKTKPLSVFILSNEHGLNGDALIPSMVVMRLAKDLCKNTDNPFLKWLKENCMITMIPVGNPWGYGRYLVNNSSGYYNSNNVNINRNYDTPGWASSDTNYGDTPTFGEYPGCEIETQHIMNTMRLCKPDVGISMHGLGYPAEYRDIIDNGYFIYQGQGFDASRMNKITETLYSSYGLGPGSSVDYGQHYQSCGKSPAYIQYCGAVGGLTETICWEAGTENEYTSVAMEQAYTQLLLFLQTWIEEALEKDN